MGDGVKRRLRNAIRQYLGMKIDRGESKEN
jgi:hypothetical protein